MKVNVYNRRFIVTAGVILSVTGIAKIFGSLGQARLLYVSDPLLGIAFGHLMFLTGMMEVFIALICFFSDWRFLSLGLVAWLGTSFALYRFGLWWMGWRRPCACLGNLTDALGISPEAADSFMKIVLAYLIIGSYTALFWTWRQRKETTTSSPMR
jgi:hypothetical protein